MSLGAGGHADEMEAFDPQVARQCLEVAEGGAVAADELGCGLQRHRRAEVQRALVQRSGERVVDGHDGAWLARRGADRLEVCHAEQGVGRRLEPDQVGRAAGVDPARRIVQSHALHRPATAIGAGSHQSGDALVAVVRQHHRRAGMELIEDRGDGRHAGGGNGAVICGEGDTAASAARLGR